MVEHCLTLPGFDVTLQDQPIHLVIAGKGAIPAVAGKLGCDPDRKAVRLDGCDRVAIAPGKWLLVGAIDVGTLAHSLGKNASLIEMESAYVRLSLVGPGLFACLARGVPLDLEDLRPGDAAVTSVAGINLVLWLIEPDQLELAITRSLYRSFLHWLGEAAGLTLPDAT